MVNSDNDESGTNQKAPTTGEVWAMVLSVPVKEPRALLSSDFWWLLGMLAMITIMSPFLRLASGGPSD